MYSVKARTAAETVPTDKENGFLTLILVKLILPPSSKTSLELTLTVVAMLKITIKLFINNNATVAVIKYNVT